MNITATGCGVNWQLYLSNGWDCRQVRAWGSAWSLLHVCSNTPPQFKAWSGWA